jgi:uncharacterized membrane protein
VRSNLKVRIATILSAPILFWMLATGIDVARRDPEALETPLAYLVFTWLLYLPVFGIAGILAIIGRRFFRCRNTLLLSLGALICGGLSVLALGIAGATYRLPMRVWPLCVIVGTLMGAVLLRSESSESP